ncbi:MAG: sulfatase-modifying factor enzyme 1 family protein [Eubacterium sp.]|jgi:formylglycine-generating enzyme required for sulfatase activity|nr:sulfatase-modifying factor enzyme 1 family protein [Eubacterium sp.]
MNSSKINMQFDIEQYPMTDVPGGIIELRDDRTKNRWLVKLKPYLMGRFPVTGGLYSAVTQNLPVPAEAAHKPIVNVSWNDAISFCNQLSQKAGLKECYTISNNGEKILCNWDADGYRLPSEAEWQYACMAGTADYRYGELDHIAWFSDNSDGRTHAVGEKEPNPWGLYDMLGNVWEWCWDIYAEKVYGSYRIFRGGSWAEAARGCGATCRRRSHPTFMIDDLGFRIARSL